MMNSSTQFLHPEPYGSRAGLSPIIDLVKRIRRQIFFFTLIESMTLFVGIGLSVICILTLVDYFLNFSFVLRRGLSILVPFSILTFIVYYVVFSVRKNWQEERIAALVQSKYPILKDDLINALQLGCKETTYFSQALVNVFIEQVAEKIKIISPHKVFRPLRLKNYLLFTLFCFLVLLLLHFTFPGVLLWSIPRLFLVEPTISLKVSPGNLSLLRGSDLEITAEINILEKEALILVYRFSGGSWYRKPLLMSAGGKYGFVFHTLLDNLEYAVRCKKLSSELYKVKIVSPPEVGDIKLEYLYPSYTGLTPEVIEKTDGNISALPGTRVIITARVNKPLSKGNIIFADGQVLPLKSKKSAVEGKLVVSKENVYWFELEDTEGYTNPTLQRYTIHLVRDELPKIQILSPNEDLIVSEKTKLKLTYEISDDYGITEVNLFYRSAKENTFHPVLVEHFKPVIKEKILDWTWDLSTLGAKPGEVIEYYLEATDNDIILGPKKTTSQSLKLEIFSYEREHETIENEIHQFRENLLNILAEQINAQELSVKISTVPPELQGPLWQELANLQNTIREKTKENIKNLSQTLERMKNDPLTTQRTYEEYASLKDNLEYLYNRPMDEILGTISKKEINETMHKQEEIVTSLEKMSLLSEDILEYQRMYDLLTSAQDVNEIGSKLTENLEKLSSLDTEKTKELNQTLDKIGELFNKIGQLLTKMPEELPEEFVNQAAVKEVNLAETQNLIDQLRQAISQGDLNTALKYAKSLAESLNQFLETLQNAAQSSVYGEMNNLTNEVEKYADELDELTKKENDLVSETAKYEQKRLDHLLQKQEELLKELTERQKKVVERTQNLSRDNPAFQWQFHRVIPNMQKVYDEFSQGQVYNSRKWLEEIISELENLKNYIGRSLPQGSEQPIFLTTKEIQTEEQEILNLLKKEPEVGKEIFDEKEKNGLLNLGKKQNEIGEQSKRLNKKLQEFARKTALLKLEVNQNLRNAVSAMQNAENALTEFSTGKAIDKEKEAVYWLSQGKEGIEQAMQKLGQGEKKSVQPMAGFIQHPATGIYGVRIGYVKLPGAEEYKPPKQFREEILQSLKEKYPKLYERLIKEYYKRLTE